ncbi:MAG TPA: class I SAM-dependent methyltransferase [Steroidobacteraceae bacterium]|nr:class I SAM-dependent methyltransferase [Steroidobacteraceae bacterium]
MKIAKEFVNEVADGERFEFGSNWAKFLRRLDDGRITESINAICNAFRGFEFRGKSVLDIGSGSGVSSLAFRRLDAVVTSFDFDPNSVACTQELKRREGAAEEQWRVLRGSVLDSEFVSSLGQFDVVYSWGVLHHTGEMWRAIEIAQHAVRPGGRFCIAIYNDQGIWSRYWLGVKKAYNRCPRFLRWLIVLPASIQLWGPRMVYDLLTGHPFRHWRTYAKNRGMSPWHDIIDWVGGLPFEVASPDVIFRYFSERNFKLLHLKTCGGRLGCNEFTFEKAGS